MNWLAELKNNKMQQTKESSELDRAIKNHSRTNLDIYIKHRSDKIAYLQLNGNVRNELELKKK